MKRLFLIAALLLPAISNAQQSVQGTPNGFPVAIQGVASGIPIPVADSGTGSPLCTQTTLAKFQTVGVANAGGTSITSTTSCIAGVVYVSNTSNSAVTLRLQDKAGTPVIWVGGNADFSIPANGNLQINLTGLVFTSGITAIAGTNAVLNLYIPTLQ